MYLSSHVLDEFPSPPGSAYPGARPGEPGYEQDKRPYGQAAGSRPYGQDQRQDQRPGMAVNDVKVWFSTPWQR